jgi:hypothetical protein
MSHLSVLQVDSPKEAQTEEEKGSKFDSGASGMDERAETHVEQKEKPKGSTEGDSQNSVSKIKTPTDVGEARTKTSVSTPPCLLSYRPCTHTGPSLTARYIKQPERGRQGALNASHVYLCLNGQ